MGLLQRMKDVGNLAREGRGRKNRPATVDYEPTSVQIEVTNNCNLLCNFCGRTNLSNLEAIGSMNLEKFQHIFNQFNHLRSVSLFGHGEPLMSPYLFDIVRWIRAEKGKRFKINITSNGILLKQKIVDQLVENDVRLTVSFDATTPETYVAMVGAPTFHKVLEGLDRLRVATETTGFKWSLNYVLGNENIGEMVEMVEWAKKYRARRLNIGEQNFYGAGGRKEDAFIKLRDELRDTVAAALKKGNEIGQKIRLNRRDKHVWPEHDVYVPCKYLWAFPFISWDGYVCLCCARPYPKVHHFGNVFEQSFQEIWFSERYAEYRTKVAGGTENTVCKGCQHLHRDAEEEIIEIDTKARAAKVRKKTAVGAVEAPEPKGKALPTAD